MKYYGPGRQTQDGTDVTGNREMAEGVQQKTAVYRRGTWRWPCDGNWRHVKPTDSTWADGHFQQTMTANKMKAAMSQPKSDTGKE